jgi:hypothetical protein
MSLDKYRIEENTLDWWYVEFRFNFYRTLKKQYKITLHSGEQSTGEAFCFPEAKGEEDVRDVKFDFCEYNTNARFYVPFSEIDKIENA